MIGKAIMIATAAVYAVWTPFYFLNRPAPVIPPTGERVELILPAARNDEAGRLVRLHGFRQHAGDLESPDSFVVYEDTSPLPSSHYEFEPIDPKNRWRFVRFRSSDGSDPRYNGRRYYAVIPQ